MKVIGLTGGIGSGKSTVARVFEALGVPVFYADDEAIRAYDDPAIRQAVSARFGDGLFPSGKLDRAALSARVFGDTEALAALNALIHPAVAERWKHWKALQHAPYVIREAAILFESGSDAGCDAVVLVTAPEELRIRRVMERDGVEEAAVRLRMSRQWTDAQKRERANYELVNDGEELLLPMILRLDNTFRS